jgi:hypothetical protein
MLRQQQPRNVPLANLADFSCHCPGSLVSLSSVQTTVERSLPRVHHAVSRPRSRTEVRSGSDLRQAGDESRSGPSDPVAPSGTVCCRRWRVPGRFDERKGRPSQAPEWSGLKYRLFRSRRSMQPPCPQQAVRWFVGVLGRYSAIMVNKPLTPVRQRPFGLSGTGGHGGGLISAKSFRMPEHPWRRRCPSSFANGPASWPTS